MSYTNIQLPIKTHFKLEGRVLPTSYVQWSAAVMVEASFPSFLDLFFWGYVQILCDASPKVQNISPLYGRDSNM